jgi:hypothetical protein
MERSRRLGVDAQRHSTGNESKRQGHEKAEAMRALKLLTSPVSRTSREASE